MSGVDHPAHLTEGWLVMKDASPETADLLARAEAVARGIDPSTISKGESMPNAPKFDKAALSADVVEYIESLEATVAKNATPSTEPTEAELFAKSIASLPEPVRKAITATQREAAEAKADAAKLVAERDAAAYLAKAKELAYLPKVKVDEFAVTMQKARSGDHDALDAIFEVLKASNAALQESGLFAPIGSDSDAAGNALATLNAHAVELQKADATLTEAQAMTKAAELHPDLYAQHLKES